MELFHPLHCNGYYIWGRKISQDVYQMLLDVVANVFTWGAEQGAFPHFDSFSFKSFGLVKEG